MKASRKSEGKQSVKSLMHICIINKSLYSCISNEIDSVDVIITSERIEHLSTKHPFDSSLLKKIEDALLNPDYILRGNMPLTGVVFKRIEVENKFIEIVLRIHITSDGKGFSNSIITCMQISEKRAMRYLRTKEILYKRSNPM